MALDDLKDRIPGFDLEKPLMFCGGSREFYEEMLHEYSNENRIERLSELFKEEDWKNYQIEVHALKSTSYTFGLMKIGSMAEALEMSLKQENTDYVKEHHGELVDEFYNLKTIIEECL